MVRRQANNEEGLECKWKLFSHFACHRRLLPEGRRKEGAMIRLERRERRRKERKSFINHRITNPVGTFPLLAPLQRFFLSFVNPPNRSLFANNFLIYHYQPSSFLSHPLHPRQSPRSGWKHDRVARGGKRESLSGWRERNLILTNSYFSILWWIFHHFSRRPSRLPLLPLHGTSKPVKHLRNKCGFYLMWLW